MPCGAATSQKHKFGCLLDGSPAQHGEDHDLCLHPACLLILVPGMHLSYLLLGAFGQYVATGFQRVAWLGQGSQGL